MAKKTTKATKMKEAEPKVTKPKVTNEAAKPKGNSQVAAAVSAAAVATVVEAEEVATSVCSRLEPPPQLSTTFVTDIYAVLSRYDTHQLELIYRLAGAMLHDAYRHGERSSEDPYKRRVRFDCGHTWVVQLPLLEPFALQRELELYHNAPCPNCLATQLAHLCDGRVEWLMPVLSVETPQQFSYLFRRRYERVHAFVKYLAALPKKVRQASLNLTSEIHELVNESSGAVWLDMEASFLDTLLARVRAAPPPDEGDDDARADYNMQVRALHIISEYETERAATTVPRLASGTQQV